MRVVAVDWSGKRQRPEEAIWIAEVRDGQLTGLENGRGREQVAGHLIALATRGGELAVGLDFAFSFPAWWCRRRGWTSAPEVWAAIESEGEDLLAACKDPFWGRPGRRNPHPPERALRETERREGTGAKSAFQIGGAGSVGTGSIRGMPLLRRLAEAGFGIWPFDPDWPRVLEIYPRALSGPVRKSRWAERHAYLFERFGAQPDALLERAAGSEDAFDAAVSALVMSEHAEALRAEPEGGRTERLEGRIWLPPG